MRDLDFPTILIAILFFGGLALLGYFWKTHNLYGFITTVLFGTGIVIMINEYHKKKYK